MAGGTTPETIPDDERPTLEEVFASVEKRRDLRGTVTVDDIVTAIREDREAGHRETR